MAETTLSATPLDAQSLDHEKLQITDSAPKNSETKDTTKPTYEAVKFEGQPKVNGDLLNRTYRIAERFWEDVRTSPISTKTNPPTALGLLYTAANPQKGQPEVAESQEAKVILDTILDSSTQEKKGLLVNEFKSLEKIINEDQQMRDGRTSDRSLMLKAARQYPEPAKKLIDSALNDRNKTLSNLKSHENLQRTNLAKLFITGQKNDKYIYKEFKNAAGEVIVTAKEVERFHKELVEVLKARQSEIREQVTERYRKDIEEITFRFNHAVEIACAVIAENRKRLMLAKDEGTEYKPVRFFDSSSKTGPHDYAHRWYEEHKDKEHKTYFKVTAKHDPEKFLYLGAMIKPLVVNGEQKGWELEIVGPINVAVIKQFIFDAVGKGCTHFNISELSLSAAEKRQIALHIMALTGGDPKSVDGYTCDSQLQKAATIQAKKFREKNGLCTGGGGLEPRNPIPSELYTPKPIKVEEEDVSLSARPTTAPPSPDLSARPIPGPPNNPMLASIAQGQPGAIPIPRGQQGGIFQPAPPVGQGPVPPQPGPNVLANINNRGGPGRA
jgi:hypothetical protein